MLAIVVLLLFVLLFVISMVAMIVGMLIGNDFVSGIGYVGAVSSFFLALFTVILSGLCEEIQK